MMVCALTIFQAFTILLLIGTGSLNTIVLKWQSQLLSKNSVGAMAPFSHPFLQSTFMFLGQMFCLGVFYSNICWQRSGKTLDPESSSSKTGHGSIKVSHGSRKTSTSGNQALILSYKYYKSDS